MKIVECTQGSPEWWAARAGIPTASEFSRIVQAEIGRQQVGIDDARAAIANPDTAWFRKLREWQRSEIRRDVENATNKDGSPSKSVKYARYTAAVRSGKDATQRYIADLRAEAKGWRRDEFKGSPHIERGHALESEMRAWVAMELGRDVERVGFCLSDCERYGCSPDGLIGIIPIEGKAPDLNTFYLWQQIGGLPNEHKQQCHGALAVTGAPYMYFCAYPDPCWKEPSKIFLRIERDDYTDQLKSCVEEFCDELAEVRAKIEDPGLLP